MLFHDRRNAGVLLANKMSNIPLKKDKTIIVALLNGGVPVAVEIARKLQIPMDVILVKKIGSPNFPDLTIGSVCEDEEVFLNEDIIESLGFEVSDVAPFKEHAMKNLQKVKASLRREYPALPLEGKDVVLVDDGIISGATMEAVIRLIRKRNVGKIIVASPVCSIEAMNHLGAMVDMIEVAIAPPLVNTVGEWYEDFAPVETEEVIDLLCESTSRKNLNSNPNSEEIIIKDLNITLSGNINASEEIKSWVIFAHGSGSSHKSVRNMNVSRELAKAGHATLLFDLLTEDEDAYSNRFNIPLLAKRLRMATRWLLKSKFYKEGTPIAYFGASTGAAAALMAVSNNTEQDLVYAVISRGGRPDMVDKNILSSIYTPTLLIVGEEDFEVIDLNKIAAESLPNCRVKIVPRASHLFEEPGALEEVTMLTIEWLDSHLPGNTFQSTHY